MKIFITILSALFLATAAQAQAIESNGFSARLNSFQMDRGLGLGAKAGMIVINLEQKTAELALRSTDNQVISMDLKIKSIDATGCGVLNVTAEQNGFDGNRQILVITNRSKSKCGEDKSLPVTAVELRTESLQPRQSTRSFLSGGALLPSNTLRTAQEQI